MRTLTTVLRPLVLAALLAAQLPGLAPPLVDVQAAPAQDEPGVTVLDERVEYRFSQYAQFTLEAKTSEPVERAELLFTPIGARSVFFAPITFEPSTHPLVSYTVDLKTVVPPPFSRVLYRWQLTTVSGRTLQATEREFFYEDNRYEWFGLSITRTADLPAMEVHWVSGDQSLATAALNSALTNLPRIQAAAGARLDSTVRIYLYPSAEALQSALRLSGWEWVGGHADTRLGVVLLAAPPGPLSLPTVINGVPHELTHLAIYSRTRDRYGSVPPWLDEGLATMLEPDPDPARAELLDAAVRDDTLVSLAGLCAPFSPDDHTARLEYAESESLVRYVINRYGAQKIQELLDAHADRNSVDPAACDGAIREVLYISRDRLESDWRDSLGQQSDTGRLVQVAGPFALLLGLFTLTALFFVTRSRRAA
jgi:hypothetical protein